MNIKRRKELEDEVSSMAMTQGERLQLEILLEILGELEGSCDR